MNKADEYEILERAHQAAGAYMMQKSPRADELIACLEGEIAKRDEELAACRIAVENCEVFRARIAELEQDLAYFPSTVRSLAETVTEREAEINQLRAELAALKAKSVMPDVNSAAKALCDRHAMICGVDADDQWKEYNQDFIADAETVLANARLNAAPVQQASVPDGWRELAKRADDFLYSLPETDGVLRLRADLCSMLAAPAAPAADAGLVEALEEMVAMIDSGDEPGSGSEWHKKASAALAARRAQGCA